jgi:hypothetical protein
MISLYDYLGKAARAELGKKVWEYSKIRKARKDVRNISNPLYQGKIMLYEREFLDEFFKVEKIFNNDLSFKESSTTQNETSKDLIDDDPLPF